MTYLSIVTWEFFSPCSQSVIAERFYDEVSNLLFGRRLYVNIPGFVKIVQQGAQRLRQSHRIHIEQHCKTKFTSELVKALHMKKEQL